MVRDLGLFLCLLACLLSAPIRKVGSVGRLHDLIGEGKTWARVRAQIIEMAERRERVRANNIYRIDLHEVSHTRSIHRTVF